MRDVIVITILLRTYYNVYLLFLYISRNTYIRKSIETDSVKKYRIYENNELFPYSHSLCTCNRIGARYLAKCGCQLYCHYSWCCLLIPGVISLFGYFGRKRQEGEAAPRFPIEGIGSLLFGLWLIVMPEFFADVLMFLLGFILIMGGVQQIASLSMARRWMPVPGAFYPVPSLILIAGIIALFNPTGARNTAFIIIGVSSLVYSLTELINWFKFTRRRPKTPVVHDDDDIEDAKIIE